MPETSDSENLAYPWYAIKPDDLQVEQAGAIWQGDIIDKCTVFLPPADIEPGAVGATFEWRRQDVIVMSQSCDP